MENTACHYSVCVCVCVCACVCVCVCGKSMFACVFTSISVEHGYIQVCGSGVDDVLFQSLTSQKIFSNRERAEK